MLYEVITRLADHPAWQGTVEALRLHLSTWGVNRSRIERLRGLSEQVVAPKLRQAMARPWKVELDHVLRNAQVVEPQSTTLLRLTVPPAARSYNFV